MVWTPGLFPGSALKADSTGADKQRGAGILENPGVSGQAMLRIYVIGIGIGFVLRLLIGFRRTLRRRLTGDVGMHDTRANGRSGAAPRQAPVNLVLHSAVAGLFWPCMILRGAAYLLMVSAVKFRAHRECQAYERVMAERLAEQLAEQLAESGAEAEPSWRKAA